MRKAAYEREHALIVFYLRLCTFAIFSLIAGKRASAFRYAYAKPCSFSGETLAARLRKHVSWICERMWMFVGEKWILRCPGLRTCWFVGRFGWSADWITISFKEFTICFKGCWCFGWTKLGNLISWHYVVKHPHTPMHKLKHTQNTRLFEYAHTHKCPECSRCFLMFRGGANISNAHMFVANLRSV